MIRSKLAVWVVLIVTVLAASWPMFMKGMYRAHDYVHVARFAEFQRGLLAGHWPVRWSSNFGFGYGMPIFEFYAPLPYALGAALMLLGFSGVLALKIVMVASSVLTATAGYAYGRSWGSRAAGLATAAVLTMAPYRALNLGVRGALSETWGLAWLAASLWAVRRICLNHHYGVTILTLTLTAVTLSHNLSAMMGLPLILCLSLVWTLPQKNWRVLGRIALGFGLSFALSAFFALPALVENSLTALKQVSLSGYFDFHLHFLYLRQLLNPSWGYGGSAWGVHDGISFFWGYGQILAILLLTLVLLNLIRQRNQILKHSTTTILFSLVAVGVAVLLTTPKLLFVWEAIPLLATAQFPWRFLGIALLALAVGLPLAINHLGRLARLLTAGLLLILCWLNAPFFKPESWQDFSDSLYYTDAVKIQTHMSDILLDYIPVGLKYTSQIPASGLINSVSLNGTDIKILENKPELKMLDISTLKSQSLVLNIANFPGWQAQIGNQPLSVTSTEFGLIQIEVPAGRSTLKIKFADTPIRAWSDWISALAVLAWISVLALEYRQKPVITRHQ